LEQKGNRNAGTNVKPAVASEGIEIDTSTLAELVDARTATLSPLVELMRRHCSRARRHRHDTTIPVLPKQDGPMSATRGHVTAGSAIDIASSANQILKSVGY
jgi:transposase IS66 family protein